MKSFLSRFIVAIFSLIPISPWASAAPRDVDVEGARAFWAFQHPDDPRLPDVQDMQWCRSPLDRFVLADLEAAGLTPAPETDRRTLIRRATYDLIGLPPTIEEINDFLSDTSPDAFRRVIDRLLASPRYGERWGRHWLDVARYADSNGLDENLAYADAFRYRDYVIDAFNRDMSYDRFVREQLAGDLLPAAENEDPPRKYARWIATGFLSLGPKMLACDDGRKMEMDIVDEQLDTTSRAFMGITMGCARCHDHKFDPFSTEDYYGLAGIFKSTKTMEHFKVVAEWHEYTLATPEQQESAKAKLKKSNAKRKKTEPVKPSFDMAMGVCDGKIEDLRVHVRGNYLTLGDVVPRRFPHVLSSGTTEPISPTTSGRLELARWLTDGRHPLTARVMANRVWLWHFGAGIVRTPDNFGRLGDPPTSQALLDALAVSFMRSGWSIKQLHRTIMLSATYRMSSRFDALAAEKDPQNRRWWRFPRRRLDAEQIRDSILAVAGDLDLQMYGQLMPDKNRDYVTGTGSKQATYDFGRRSVYLPVLRSAVYPVFQAFDFGDPSVMQGQRATTTVAPQALFMMNSSIVARTAKRLAAELVRQEQLDDRQRARWAYERILRRPPSPAETARVLKFIGSHTTMQPSASDAKKVSQHRAWQSLCRVLVASNEFVYVD